MRRGPQILSGNNEKGSPGRLKILIRVAAAVVLCVLALAACASQQTTSTLSAAPTDQLHQAFDAYYDRDYKAAYDLLLPLAESGNADAQSQLGNMYMRGNYVRQNFDKGLEFYHLAAKQGNARAQSQIGGAYERGLGVPVNYEEAVRWYRLAVSQDSTTGQTLLAGMYERGLGVEQNFAESARLLGIAAEKGIPFAQGKLGLHYAAGTGVPIDLVEAYKWFTLVQGADHPAHQGMRELALREMRVIEQRMTAGQIAEAKRLAHEWKPSVPCKDVECWSR